jgi:Fic family protein
MNNFTLKPLSPNIQLESIPILKKVAHAQRYLAELKGISLTIPNQNILINTLPMLEAKDSSAIENIIYTK